MTAHKSLLEAWLAFQADPPKIELDATNPHFRNRFASLPGNLGAIRKRLSEEGLVFVQALTHIDGDPAMCTTIAHAATGEKIEAVTPLLLGGKTDPQSHGSAVTYARRYGLYSILGLVGDEDDDGNTSSQGDSPAKVAPATAPQPTKPAEGVASPSPSAGAGGDEPEFAPDMPKVEQDAFPVPTDGITDKQLKFLKTIATKLTKADLLTVEDYRKHLAEAYGKTATASLTKKEATEEIERLKEQATAAGLME